MKLYHGTTVQNMASIQADGITAPSYWGTEAMAKQYAASFGADGVVLVADIDDSDLQANLLVANCLYENGDIDEIPEIDDLDFSLENLEGVLCTVDVMDSAVLESAPARPLRKRHQEEDLAP